MRGTRVCLSALCIAMSMAVFASSSSALAFHYTHTVEFTVTVTDHWTRTIQFGCGPAGSGTVRYKVSWRRPVKAQPMINGAAGRWTLLVPGPGGTSELDLSAQKVAGTITYSAQTALTGEMCPAGVVDARGCHSYSLAGDTGEVFGLDRRSLEVNSSVETFSHVRPRGSCQLGIYNSFNDDDFFAHPMTIRMPAPGALRKRKLIVTGSSTGHFKGDDPSVLNAGIDETVTKTAAVTFKRL